MSEASPDKYSAEEWNHFRKRFLISILKDTEIAKLGQNVGISWPFKGKGETASKYIEYDLEELRSVPGLVGKPRRIEILMDILRETLAFDDPFSDMVDTVELESLEDDTYERILAKLEIPPSYPREFIHFKPETSELLKSEGASTLLEVIHFGQELRPSVVVGADLKTFLNGLTHKDEVGIANYLPYRRGIRGLHLAEAIGLIARDLPDTAQLHLLAQTGQALTEEESGRIAQAGSLNIEGPIQAAVNQVGKVNEWFSGEAAELEEAFTKSGSPERYFIVIDDPRRERLALELAKLQLKIGDSIKPGFLGKLFGR